MDLETNLHQYCPENMVHEVQHIKTLSQENALPLLRKTNKSVFHPVCLDAFLGTIAPKITPLTDEKVFSSFLSNVATHHSILSTPSLKRVKAAIEQGRYSNAIAFKYFTALRYTKIDLREHIKPLIIEDWSFTHPRHEKAATWHYYLYLSSLQEPGAIEALADKIANTENGNDATNLLKSLYDLNSEAALGVLSQYKDDTRRADGPDGPGQMIAEMVQARLP